MKNSFTIKGFNDCPQPCLEDCCDGLVVPTSNANVGRCNSCERKYNWGNYWEKIGQYESVEKSKV